MSQPLLHIVLYQPEIPQNTGNIGRTCVALGAKLWIVRPTGFHMDETQLKRAGLDYWQHLDWELVDQWTDLPLKVDVSSMYGFTKLGKTLYTEATYRPGQVLLFGSETNGLPPSVHQSLGERTLRIPIVGPVRSLNLATSVGIAAYEAYRQIQAAVA